MRTDVETAAELMGDECLVKRVRMVARSVSSLYDEALRPLGVTSAQLNFLAMMANAGPIAPGEAAKRMVMEKSTLSRNVRLMEERGWLRVSPGETGRSKQINLTAAGRRMLRDALPSWREAQAAAEGLLGVGGVKAVHRAAKAVESR